MKVNRIKVDEKSQVIEIINEMIDKENLCKSNMERYADKIDQIYKSEGEVESVEVEAWQRSGGNTGKITVTLTAEQIKEIQNIK